jgi:excisionase family DNA binding protein
MSKPIPFEQIPALLVELSQEIKELKAQVARLSGAVEDPMDIEAAARFLGLERSTVYGLVSARKIPFHKNGKVLRFFKSELAQYIKAA